MTDAGDAVQPARPSAAQMEHDWFPQQLPANVELGAGTWLYSAFAFIHCRSRRAVAVRVGRSSGIYNGSFFELGAAGEVSIGDHTTLVGAIIATNGRVRIGNYCFVAHEVVIGDTSFARPPDGDQSPGSIDDTAPCIDLADDVWVGAGAILLAGARIGRGAIIGAAAVVDFDVPAFAIVGGNPARVVGFAEPRAETAE